LHFGRYNLKEQTFVHFLDIKFILGTVQFFLALMESYALF